MAFSLLSPQAAPGSFSLGGALAEVPGVSRTAGGQVNRSVTAGPRFLPDSCLASRWRLSAATLPCRAAGGSAARHGCKRSCRLIRAAGDSNTVQAGDFDRLSRAGELPGVVHQPLLLAVGQ